MSIRDEIEAARTARGLSQNELARISGITQAAISRYLSGKCNMRVSLVERLMRVLGLRVIRADWHR